jgi:hypothetical protein
MTFRTVEKQLALFTCRLVGEPDRALRLWCVEGNGGDVKDSVEHGRRTIAGDGKDQEEAQAEHEHQPTATIKQQNDKTCGDQSDLPMTRQVLTNKGQLHTTID